MSKQQHDDRSNEIENHDHQQVSAKIGDQVLRVLGQPSDLHRMQIRRLWKDRYRVNVLVGADFVSAKVAHSYFIVTDENGNIITSAPQIARKYRPATLPVPVAKGDLPMPAIAPQVGADGSPL